MRAKNGYNLLRDSREMNSYFALQDTFSLWIVHLRKGTWSANVDGLVENMGLTIETNE